MRPDASFHDTAVEVDRLRAWKADALLVLNRWDNAYERAGIKARPADLGRCKGDVMADEILRLRARIRVLDAALSDAEHRLTLAQPGA